MSADIRYNEIDANAAQWLRNLAAAQFMDNPAAAIEKQLAETTAGER